MKKLLFIVFALISFTAVKAQAVFEHEYKGFFRTFHLDNYGYIYAGSVLPGDSIIEVRTKDHVLIKTIHTAEPDYLFGGVYSVSDHLFNSDDKIEILYAEASINGTNHKLILKNEDNDILQTFPVAGFDSDYPKIYQFDSEFKLAVIKYDGYNWVQDIYSLPGSTILNVPEEEHQNQTSSSFPNPSDKFINVRYPEGSTEIMIFNIKGLKTYSEPVSGSGIEKINTSTYPNGCYVYKIMANYKEISSEKFLITR